jgi:hypothetical protein
MAATIAPKTVPYENPQYLSMPSSWRASTTLIKSLATNAELRYEPVALLFTAHRLANKPASVQ